jgi:hypothetical protein
MDLSQIVPVVLGSAGNSALVVGGGSWPGGGRVRQIEFWSKEILQTPGLSKDFSRHSKSDALRNGARTSGRGRPPDDGYATSHP